MDNNDQNKGELEEEWVDELIQRKKEEVERGGDEPQEDPEETKNMSNYYTASAAAVNQASSDKMQDDIRSQYSTLQSVSISHSGRP